MLQAYWLALAAFALIFTLVWSIGETRINMAAALSGVAWAVAGITGGTVEQRLDTGDLVSAAVSEELRYLCLGLALLSFLAMVLHWFSIFPPGAESPAEATTN